MKSIEELATLVWNQGSPPVRGTPEKVIDFATRFLAAYTEQQEPVGWMDRDGDFYRLPVIENWSPPHTLLYAAPVVPADMVLVPREPTPEIITAIDKVMWPGASEKAYKAMITAGEKKS